MLLSSAFFDVASSRYPMRNGWIRKLSSFSDHLRLSLRTVTYDSYSKINWDGSLWAIRRHLVNFTRPMENNRFIITEAVSSFFFFSSTSWLSYHKFPVLPLAIPYNVRILVCFCFLFDSSDAYQPINTPTHNHTRMPTHKHTHRHTYIHAHIRAHPNFIETFCEPFSSICCCSRYCCCSCCWCCSCWWWCVFVYQRHVAIRLCGSGTLTINHIQNKHSETKKRDNQR